MPVDSTPTPRKPEVTKAPLAVLIAHYNSKLPDYNASLEATASAGRTTSARPMQPLPEDFGADRPDEAKLEVIELIRKQNRKLGHTIRRRSLELLEMRIKGPDGRPMTDEDGRSVGLKYNEVLGIIQSEFPEASTTVACLRWYVVHLRMDANDLGLPWPDMPQIRPRDRRKSSQEASA